MQYIYKSQKRVLKIKGHVGIESPNVTIQGRSDTTLLYGLTSLHLLTLFRGVRLHGVIGRKPTVMCAYILWHFFESVFVLITNG